MQLRQTSEPGRRRPLIMRARGAVDRMDRAVVPDSRDFCRAVPPDTEAPLVAPPAAVAFRGKRVTLDEVLDWEDYRTVANPFLKRTIDIVAVIVLATVFLPMIVFVVLWMRFTSRGPILFRHERIGLFGRRFQCWKFRTMVENSDQVLQAVLDSDPEAREEWLATRKLKNDPRITRVGRFLRKTSLDELPQLWNVLIGDMSLVGPRPVVQDEIDLYGRYMLAYLGAKPGLTGLWQVSGRNETSYRRRVAIDVYYTRYHSFALDMFILLRTVSVVTGGHGAY